MRLKKSPSREEEIYYMPFCLIRSRTYFLILSCSPFIKEYTLHNFCCPSFSNSTTATEVAFLSSHSIKNVAKLEGSTSECIKSFGNTRKYPPSFKVITASSFPYLTRPSKWCSCQFLIAKIILATESRECCGKFWWENLIPLMLSLCCEFFIVTD